MSEETKKCIFCAEEIKAEAKICRFCNKEQVEAKAKGNEEIFYEGSVLHRTFIGEHLMYGLIVVVGLVLIIYDGGYIDSKSSLDGLIWKLGLLLAVFGVGSSLIRVIKTNSLRWKITDQRVQTERGIFSKSVEVLQLWRIEDIQYTQSLLQRLLNEATIKLITSDRTSPTVLISGLTNHRALYEKLLDSVEKRRRENRVVTMENHGH
jgi:uncharacterized membrane protein YdbT with pleckstrin-like domain